MADPTWKNYYEKTGYEPNTLVKRALARIPRKTRTNALDLGCGNGRDSLYLKSEGFELVVAVDSSPDAPAFLGEGILRRAQTIEEAVLGKEGPYFDGYFDLAIALNSLFFLPKEAVEQVIPQMYRALSPGGYMAFNVLGPDDEWVMSGDKRVSWFYEHDIARFEDDYHSVYSSKVSEAGQTADGEPKFWQTYS